MSKLPVKAATATKAPAKAVESTTTPAKSVPVKSTPASADGKVASAAVPTKSTTVSGRP